MIDNLRRLQQLFVDSSNSEFSELFKAVADEFETITAERDELISRIDKLVNLISAQVKQNTEQAKVIEHIALAVGEEADPMSCYESVDAIISERDALKAPVEQLRGADAILCAIANGLTDDPISVAKGYVKGFGDKCLAERDAEVLRNFHKWLLIKRPNCGLVGMGDLEKSYIPEYANQLLQQASK